MRTEDDPIRTATGMERPPPRASPDRTRLVTRPQYRDRQGAYDLAVPLDMQRALSALELLPIEVGGLADEARHQWTPSSAAAADERLFPESEHVRSVASLAEMSLWAAGDHMVGLGRIITPPVQTHAPWTLARGVLESCAQTLWLLDPSITARGRVARAFTMRIAHLQDQHAFMNASMRDKPTLAATMNLSGAPMTRMDKVLQDAEALGLTVVRAKNRRVLGLDQAMPSVTELIARTLGADWMYRLLSASAHGRTWARLGLSLERTTDSQSGPAVQQALRPEAFFVLVIYSLEWFAAAAWRLFVWNGWPMRGLAKSLEENYDRASIAGHRRFWRGTTTYY